MPTWFLPPDFTFKPEKIPLGAIITHPKKPADVLAFPPFATENPISLPEHDSFDELAHEHSREIEKRVGLNLLARMEGILSSSMDASVRRRTLLKYGQVDHEIRNFKTPFTAATLKALVAIPEVRDHIDSGIAGKRRVYIVAGLRVTRQSFAVTKENESDIHMTTKGSRPTLVGGSNPMEVGGGGEGGVKKKMIDKYNTHPGIVFAFQVYAIKAKDAGKASANLYESSTAFMTGEGERDEQVMELVDVDAKELAEDEDEPFKFDVENIGEEDAIILFK